ncbi:MAG: hypothetical protein HQL32_11770, partial [Planctomycetes bacterium]|nr:hypothetical protein [Planctomycetota bacterium]
MASKNKILYLAGSESKAHFLHELLLQEGLHLELCHDSENALGVAKELNPELILLDVEQQESSGTEIL